MWPLRPSVKCAEYRAANARSTAPGGEQLIFRDDSTGQILDAACQNLKEGAFAEAVDALERVLERDMEYPGAASALKCAAFWNERLDKDRLPPDGFERGEMLLAQWRLFIAFAERLADVPEAVQFAIKHHVFTTALACYLGAGADADPTDAAVLLQVGRCCKGAGNYEKAIEHLERANEARREDARILAELADCYSLVNESRAAKVFFREAFFIDAQGLVRWQDTSYEPFMDTKFVLGETKRLMAVGK